MKTFKTLPPAVRAERRAYAWFFGALLAVVALCTWGTAFNPFSLFAEGDAFWTFFSEDFWPPAIPERAGRLEAILSGIGVTLAMAIASATVAAILAFFMALFASERVSPFPRVAPLVRGLATFVRNIPALVWAFILFSSLGIGTGVGFVALTLSSPAFLLGAAVVAVGSLIYLDLPWAKLASRVPDLGDVFWKLGHLDFARWELILSATKETICVAVLSTFYGMLLGLLFGMLAAANVLRVPFLAPAIKAAFTFLRAVPTPVWVLLMMVCLFRIFFVQLD